MPTWIERSVLLSLARFGLEPNQMASVLLALSCRRRDQIYTRARCRMRSWTDLLAVKRCRLIGSQGERPVPAPRPAPRRCYLCNSPAHLASDCPQKSSYRGYTPKPVPRPQVNFCKTKQKVDPPNSQRMVHVCHVTDPQVAVLNLLVVIVSQWLVLVCTLRTAASPMQLVW